jgi:hypothetical protein
VFFPFAKVDVTNVPKDSLLKDTEE